MKRYILFTLVMLAFLATPVLAAVPVGYSDVGASVSMVVDSPSVAVAVNDCQPETVSQPGTTIKTELAQYIGGAKTGVGVIITGSTQLIHSSNGHRSPLTEVGWRI